MAKETGSEFSEEQKATRTGGWMINLIEGKVTFVNRTYRIFGIDKKSFDKTFKSVMKLIHPDDLKPIMDFGKKLLKTKKPDNYEIEHRIIRPDGQVCILKETIRTNFDKDGNLQMINGTAYDVTTKRLSEKTLKESEERYRSIFECSQAVIIIVDNDRKITEFNPEAYKKYGYTPEEIINKDDSILYPNSEDVMRVSKALNEKGKFVGKVTSVRKNGETFVAQLSASILLDADGNKIGAVGSSLEVQGA
jgi:two-component system sensor kinase FixL